MPRFSVVHPSCPPTTSPDLAAAGVLTAILLLAGLAAGIMEAVAVVTPMEVIKIRLQAQNHSRTSSIGGTPKYRNALHTLHTILKEEGIGALYRGVSLTALRQGSNQAGTLRQGLFVFPPGFEATAMDKKDLCVLGKISSCINCNSKLYGIYQNQGSPPKHARRPEGASRPRNCPHRSHFWRHGPAL